jgi:H+/gluconate symporter-like permease
LQVGTMYYFAATAYDTNGLESDFSAELVYTNGYPSAPQITTLVKTADGNFTVSGIAAAGQVCVLLAATNLVPPVMWTPIATNTADAQATFSMTDLQATNYPRRFYQISQTATALASPGK